MITYSSSDKCVHGKKITDRLILLSFSYIYVTLKINKFMLLQIVIEGVRGAGYIGDTAIDDVKLTEGDECTDEPITGSYFCYL